MKLALDPQMFYAMASVQELPDVAASLEREGIRLVLEPHPDDFIEDGLDAVGMIRGLNRAGIGFLHCTPHAFHQGHSPTTIIEAAGDRLTYVHLADAFDHTASHGLRYITNPPSNAVRVHQHMEVGRGDVDHDAVFAALASVGFDRHFGASTAATLSRS